MLKCLGKTNNQKGSILLVVMVFTLVAAIMAGGIVSSLVNVDKFADVNEDKKFYQMILYGSLDYTVHAVKNQWCLTDYWTRDSKCPLGHGRNTAQLLFSESGLKYVMQTNPGLTKDVLIKSNDSPIIKYSTLTSDHPLRGIVRNANIPNLLGIKFRIERIDNIHTPARGASVYLLLTATLYNDDEEPILTETGAALSATTNIALYPRELGSFALIVGDDLKIASGTSPDGQGDVYIPPSSKTGTGLRFESPVFVNGDVFVPFDSPTAPVFSNVTFADRVVVGGGTVKFGESDLAQPMDAGSSEDKFYSQSSSFGGFLQGVDLDPERDIGLDVLSGRSTGLDASTNDVNLCIELAKAKMDLRVTEASAHIIKKENEKTESGIHKYDYSLALADRNRFTPQEGVKPRISIIDWGKFSKADFFQEATYIKVPYSRKYWTGVFFEYLTDDKAIAKMNVNFGESKYNVEIEMSDDATVVLKPNLIEGNYWFWKGFIDKAEDNFEDSEDDILDQEAIVAAKKTIMDNKKLVLDNSISDLEGLGLVIAAVDANEASFTPSDPITPEEQEIQNYYTAKGEYKIAKDNYDAALATLASIKLDSTGKKSQIDIAKANLAKWEGFDKNRPEVKIQMRPYILENDTFSNQVILKVEYKNEKNFYNGVKIDVTAYDVGYQNGVNERIEKYNQYISEGKFALAKEIWNTSYSTSGQIGYTNTGVALTEAYNYLGSWDLGNKVARDSGLPIVNGLSDGFDYGYVEKMCEKGNMAFPPVTWESSFSKTSQHSWHFAPVLNSDPLVAKQELDLIIDESFASKSKMDDLAFQVFSIAKTCTIKPSANFVTGFFVCREFIIEPRSTPLTIIGTVMVISGANIADSAINSGISWKSIYNAMGVYQLRDAKVLKPYDLTKTDPIVDCMSPSAPVWNPMVDYEVFVDRDSCSPAALRRQAEPFQWTMVDPDCGLINGEGAHILCKNRVRRFMVKEISRWTKF